MAHEKRAKTKIKRRSAGLVITPPAPRPIEADHPARLLFKEAIESAKATTSEQVSAANEEVRRDVVPEPRPPSADVWTAGEATQTVPLQIFKELKGAAAEETEAATVAVREPLVTPAAAPARRKQNSVFEGHFGQWRPFLPDAQMYVLEALFNLTHALGSDRCLSSMPKLAAAAGISERQTYNVVKELEKHGFIERPEIFNTPTKKGTIFRLHLTRRASSSSGADRRYHYGD